MNEDTIKIIGAAILLFVFCSGVGTCKKWQYDECVSVGHSSSYCTADAAGCFSRNRKRAR